MAERPAFKLPLATAYSSRCRSFHRTTRIAIGKGGGASNEEAQHGSFSVLPPEINPLRMYLGVRRRFRRRPGTRLAAECAASFSLGDHGWVVGLASAAMAAAAAPRGLHRLRPAQAQLTPGRLRRWPACLRPPAPHSGRGAANREAFWR